MASYRFKEASESLWGAYPEQYIDLAEIVTNFGSAGGIVLVIALVFWLVDRERGAQVATFAVAGIALVIIVKSAFALPRPVDDPNFVVEAVIEHGDDEYGFPSGHAFMSVAIYGGFLYVFEKLKEPKWVLGLGGFAAAIALSRVFLRVHYLGDIIFGALFGLVFLIVMERTVSERLPLGFGIGVVLGVPAIVISGDPGSVVHAEEAALVGFGGAIGGLLASLRVEALPELQSRVEGAILTVCGIVFVVVVMGTYSAVVGEVGTLVDNALAVVFFVVLIAGIFSMPFVSHELEKQRQRVTGTEEPA